MGLEVERKFLVRGDFKPMVSGRRKWNLRHGQQKTEKNANGHAQRHAAAREVPELALPQPRGQPAGCAVFGELLARGNESQEI